LLAAEPRVCNSTLTDTTTLFRRIRFLPVHRLLLEGGERQGSVLFGGDDAAAAEGAARGEVFDLARTETVGRGGVYIVCVGHCATHAWRRSKSATPRVQPRPSATRVAIWIAATMLSEPPAQFLSQVRYQ